MPSMLCTKRPGNDDDQLRDVAAGGLDFDRDRDRVAVVLDEADERQRVEAGGVQRLPEFAFARRAFAERDDTTTSSCWNALRAPLDRR